MKRTFFWIVAIILLAVLIAYTYWPHLINLMLPADSRPAAIRFAVERVTPAEFDAIAAKLTDRYDETFGHIQSFRQGGILAYEGPTTCLRCHEQIEYTDVETGEKKQTDLMDNVVTSAHYRLYTERHPNVYGFNGVLADNFKMGKINRPCPKPGSFAMTAWAELVILDNGDTLSEGCGQCHMGGQYQAPLGEMMPGYRTLVAEKDAIDCLICHAAAYDMNRKQLVVDDNGRTRWDQDRSMRAALSVTKTTAQTCLRCHQHNLGGDIYVDPLDSSYHQSLTNLGYDRPRIRHPGSKRGTPYSPSWDVHAAAGLDCTECHVTEGHKIARGTHTTTLMANDLPGVEISCENCHTAQPHSADEEVAEHLNIHVGRIACQTCHIPSLHPDNATRRDFSKTEFEREPGIYVYTDSLKEVAPGTAFRYVWWNGDATFLGNAIGDNPNGKNLFRFYSPTNIWPEFAEFDYAAWYEETMRPIAQQGRPSRIYPLKVYNGRQHIDLQNIGPFGGMFVPYNLPTYYVTGDPSAAASREMEKSMMKRMYGWIFKLYMMDRFMSYMSIDGWNIGSYEGVRTMRAAEPRWIPADAAMEISHAIRLEGALTCNDCHSPTGVLDWKLLGFDEQEIERLAINPFE